MKQNARDIEEASRLMNRRGFVVGGLQLAFMGMLGLRMRQMQIEEADQYRLLAEENRVNMRLLAPPRGLIFDRNGVIIADNAQNYRIIVVREDAGDVDDVIAKLQSIVELDNSELERAIREMNRRSPFVPVTLADRLSWEDFSKVAVNTPALPGITPDVGLSREYPMGEDFAHVIGYVGPVSDFDLNRIDDPDPLLQIPKFQIGKVGVEAKLEQDLRGKAGNRRIEVNAAGRVMRELGRDEGQPGADIQLTVDYRLQNFVQTRLKGESAAAVVLDTTNGDILAIGSAPAFDPNKFVRGISGPDYRELTEDIYRPLANKTVQGTYPPGSTYKMVTALAALEEGLVSPDETVWCPGHYQLGRRRFHCWKRGGHGWVNLQKSLVQSCDVFYYDVSQRVGIDKISAMANKLGLGIQHDLPMSAVAEGLAPTQAWKRARHGEGWRVGDTLNASIGQGFTLSSPLQLAVMSARIASGNAVSPRLIRAQGGIELPQLSAQPLDISARSLRMIRQAMHNVSNGQRGTARGSRIVAEGMEMAGKTGTSQVYSITAAERAAGVRSADDLPWDKRDHALFVCFGPSEAPKYAVSVVVEHGGGGSRAAAPVARDIMLFAQYGGIPPLEAYPSSQRERIRTMYEEMVLRDPVSPQNAKSRA
ncbi:MAG: penicillin-binding protein 2 [Alphaproteobacteria bacterium]|nr:penicillin-binding protein 2 [Alphaproteobacteria bacterium]NNF25496.1 penicillin-binding protein 2 [Paracoccaceae bacterium]